MVAIKTQLKRWNILDKFTGKIIFLTDEEFAEGLENKMIDLRSRFVLDKFNREIWIDGIIKK